LSAAVAYFVQADDGGKPVAPQVMSAEEQEKKTEVSRQIV